MLERVQIGDWGSWHVAREMMPTYHRRRRRIANALLLTFFMWVGLVLLSAPGDSGKWSERVKCASNLHQIGQAIEQYSQSHHGRYPDSFATILLNEKIPAAVFNCPSTPDAPAEGDTPQAMVDHLMDGGHMSYVYLGRGLKSGAVPDRAVIVYEPLSNHEGKGMNALFGDGHVEFVQTKEAEEIIARAASGEFPVMRPRVE